MAEFATSLPLELKIDPNIDPGRKLVLRKAAEEAGLPPWIASKPKKAVQYSTGVSSTLKKLARRRRITIREYVGQLFNGRQ
jgi:asparagine synthase (glutamine-hydrolysing)